MASKRFDNQLTEDESSSENIFKGFDQCEGDSLLATEKFTSNSENPNFKEETEGLLEQEEGTPNSFWQFSYYQRFFNVNTDQVLRRIFWSMIPLPGRATFLDRQIRPPDLYGPFWITTTLVFTTAISANIADFLMTEGQDNKVWRYDFHKVSLAAAAIYSYAFIIPLAIWGLMCYRQSSIKYTLLEILCVYGYSLFIYIPISILWVIQVTWLQWLLVFVGSSLSGIVLLQTFSPIVREETSKIACVILFLIMMFHALLAVGFVAYFFQSGQVKNKTLVASVQPPNLESTSLHNIPVKAVSTSKQLMNESLSIAHHATENILSIVLNSTKAV